MAGSIVASTKPAKDRGIVKVKAVVTADASGDATVTDLPQVHGRLVAIGLVPGTLDWGNVIFTIKDKDSGATLHTIDSDAFKFSSTTTGDTTGGASEDLFTTGAAHGLAVGDIIRFITKTGGTLPTLSTNYYVIEVGSSTTFRLSATAGGAAIEIGATDVSASEWVKLVPRYFHPTAVITDNAGAAVTAATTATGVNRDRFLHGKLTLVVAQGGNLGAGELHLVVAEASAQVGADK